MRNIYFISFTNIWYLKKVIIIIIPFILYKNCICFRTQNENPIFPLFKEYVENSKKAGQYKPSDGDKREMKPMVSLKIFIFYE